MDLNDISIEDELRSLSLDDESNSMEIRSAPSGSSSHLGSIPSEGEEVTVVAIPSENKVEAFDEIEEFHGNRRRQSRSKSRRRRSIDGFQIYGHVYDQLYGYQMKGVEWLLRHFRKCRERREELGCVLVNDMGLGKTLQTICFLATLLEGKHIRCVLIVVPNTLMPHWEYEFNKWYPDVVIFRYHDKKDRFHNLCKVRDGGGVLLTTYDMLHSHLNSFKFNGRKNFVWDVCVLDEAHQIKNPTKRTRAANAIPSIFRLGLSGTPLQNNLAELWGIYDWTHRGRLLGPYPKFRTRYENPIAASRNKDATDELKVSGTQLANKLKSLFGDYFLRRTKQRHLEAQDKTSPKLD